MAISFMPLSLPVVPMRRLFAASITLSRASRRSYSVQRAGRQSHQVSKVRQTFCTNAARCSEVERAML